MRVMTVVLFLAAASLSSGETLEERLAVLVKAADSEDAVEREATQPKFDAWCRDAGDRAVPLLREAAAGKTPEVAARLAAQISFLADCRSARAFLSAFDVFQQPSSRGLRFVRYNTGGYSVYGDHESLEFYYVQGWLVRETETELVLADTALCVRTWPRKVELPKEWDKFKDSHPVVEPLPGETRDVDFTAFRSPVEKEGTTEEHFAEMMSARQGDLPQPAHQALMARWSLERDEERAALDLLLQARKLAEDSRSTQPGRKDRRTGDRIILDQLATSLRARLIKDAHRGTARSELRDGWKRLAALPEHWASKEAAAVGAAYDRQVAEDAEWREPSPEDLAKLPKVDQARVWLHRLRDACGEQGGQPGHCSVFWVYDEKAANPAEELSKLGWDAVPPLIEHLDDDSPTRSMGYWRDFAPDTYHLLTYRDACQQVFEVIAKIQIWDTRSTHDYPSFDHDPAALRRRVEACWQLARDQGPEAAYAALLSFDPRLAAENLLKLDQAKWLPRLKERALAGNPGAVKILWAMYKLIDQDADYLRNLLKSPDLGVAAWATSFLEYLKLHSEGVAVLRDRVAKLDASPSPSDLDALSGAMSEIAKERSRENAAALLGFLQHPCRAVRINAVIRAAGEPSPEVVRALVGQLSDTSIADDVFQAYTGASQIRVCDWAAYELAWALDLARDLWVDFDAESAEKDRTIGAVRNWLKANLESVDWDRVWERKR